MLHAVEVWIQAADLSAQDLGHLTAEAATAQFLSFDWDAENDRLERLLEDGGRDSCPPGMGLVVGDGHVLHLMPRRDGNLRWLFDRPGTGWFWADMFRATTVDAVGRMSDAAELIVLLYQQEFVQLWHRSLGRGARS